MTEQEYRSIHEKQRTFRRSSLRYGVVEQPGAYRLAVDSSELLLLWGRNEQQGCFEAHWAADEAEPLCDALRDLPRPLIISFVPPEWQERLQRDGFREAAVYREYWLHGLQTRPDSAAADRMLSVLRADECEEAALLTLACRDQSRGFQGETAAWFRAWLQGEEVGSLQSAATDCTVLTAREADSGAILGLACLAIYGRERAEGPALWLREIAVHPEQQGKGWGRRLLEQALLYGRQRGATRSFLMADELNERAIGLYLSFGYEPNQEEPQIDMICG